MPKIRILLVDDSAVFRRFVAEALNADPALEVVGTAANGKIALAKMPQLNPDLVILDVEMPEMDGLETLREIRKTYRQLPVIMFSALTERGAAATLDALAFGATDYFTKPTSAGIDASLQIIRDDLLPAIKALAGRGLNFPSVPPTFPSELGSPRPAQTQRVEVLAVGVSTGGPNALAEMFSVFPADFPVPIVLVQHMPPMFTRFLAERLTAQTRIKFDEGLSGGLLSPGHGWIAPGDFHMAVARDSGQKLRVQIQQEPPENSCRPAVDVLFRSVAKTFGSSTLAVVLTGMGQDGLRGCEAVREAGGQVIAQDEATSVVWGMPGFVARAGLADRVLPLAMIAPEIISRVKAGRGVPA